ncbi:DUF6691 family protein [Candidatus Viadribacter manganicus]|uniref:Transporter n=1 Tax=Candidatus Viadribacter manganicus TaxID=1759059 RepID=A0A1B1AGS2_9PROT|nr:DUF6691 family protein [Candidatus Viadribacter manganicus]ANP45762.1 hypothetical protein ATE48_07425 [Candidatus Viadribacter manganicus]
MSVILAFLLALLFGVGLIVSGMTDPARVLGFLDVAGAWDPSLAFVMGGAVMVAAPFFLLARNREKPVFAAAFEPPQSARIDLRLIGGAALFGVGWGLAGLCPGPALVVLGLAPQAVWPFVVAMMIGLGVGRWIGRARRGVEGDVRGELRAQSEATS